jgi:HEAT repeat protein
VVAQQALATRVAAAAPADTERRRALARGGRALVRTLLWTVVLSVSASAGDDITADLVWRLGEPADYGGRQLSLGAVPEGVTALAAIPSVPLGGVKLLLAANTKGGATELWVDEDFDGEIADEKAITLGAGTDPLGATVDLFLTLDENAPPQRVPVRFFRKPEDGETTLRLAPLIHREAQVVVAGRLRRLELYDQSGELRFAAPDKILLCFDLDGNGRIPLGEDSLERILPRKPFRLLGRAYSARIEGAPPRAVVLTQVEGAPPALRRPWPVLPIPPAGVTVQANNEGFAVLHQRYKDLARKRVADESVGDRMLAVAGIGSLGTKRALQFLFRVLRTDPDRRVRAAAVKAMGNRKYGPFAQRTLGLAKHRGESTPVRLAAIGALHSMDAPGRDRVLKEILAGDPDDEIVVAAARHLAYMGTKESFAILVEAVTELKRPAPRYAAYIACTRHRAGDPPRDLILAAARLPDERLSELALRDAFALGYAEARTLALERCGNPKAGVEMQIAITEVLGAAGDPEAIRALLTLAGKAPDAVSARIVEMLQPLRTEPSTAALVSALDDKSAPVRAAAAAVLTEISGPSVEKAIAARLVVEREESVLIPLVRAAGQQRIRSAADAIIAAADRESDNEDLQEAALLALGRIGFAHEPVAAFFAKRGRSREWVEIVRLLDAVVLSEDPAGAGLLVERLEHPVWQVRLVAVQGLGEIRVKPAVAALIGRLAAEPRVRIRRAIVRTLFRITGQSLPDRADLWRRWWRNEGVAFTVPAAVPRARKARPGGSTTYYGLPVDSNRVIFVIDQSGSMAIRSEEGKPSDWEKAVKETLNVVDGLRAKARLNLVLFETNVRAWRKTLVELKTRERIALRKYLSRQKPRGGTNLYDALKKALLSQGVDSIFLLSDGLPETGAYTKPEDILREIGKLNRSRRIAIHVVAIGFDTKFLEQLAEQNGGRYVAAAGAAGR